MNQGVILQVTTEPLLDPRAVEEPYWELNEDELRSWCSKEGGRRTALVAKLRKLADHIEMPTDLNRLLLLQAV